jgi:exodeoxyribonuclease VII small subunit
MTTEITPGPAFEFEDALSRLETLVDDLERGEPELSTALNKYEEGVKLLVKCQAELERAERSVALLSGVDADGKPVTAPFDATATATATAAERDTAPAGRRRKRVRPASAEVDSDDDPSIPF